MNLQAILTNAFSGKKLRFLEAAAFGALSGVAVCSAKSSFSRKSPMEGVDPRIKHCQSLGYADLDLPSTCGKLLRLVCLFLPTKVPLCISLIETLNDMSTCFEAALLGQTNYPHVGYMAHVLSEKAQDTINYFSMAFPVDSPVSRESVEVLQAVFTSQRDLYTQTRDALSASREGV